MTRGAFRAGGCAPARAERRSRFLHRGHRRAQPAARGRHQLQPRTPCRRWVTTSRRPGADRHSVPAAWKATSGFSRAAAISRWAFAARASRPVRCASAWNSTWRARHFAGRAHLLQPPAAFARRRLVAGQSRGRRWLDGGGRRRRLVDPITGEGLYYAIRSADLAARACWPSDAWRRSCPPPTARCCGAISRPIWNSARAWPNASSWADSCSARCPSAWCNSPAAARDSPPSCRICSPASSPTWDLETPPAAQPERQPLRHRHEPRLQPHGPARKAPA
jgi:hypothetical protein